MALAVLATAPLWTGRTWYLADLRMYALPDLERLQRAVWAGELRAWEPALFCGYPAIGALCAAQWYPPVLLLAALLPPLLALKAAIALHAWWLARGAVWLARELGGSRRAGLLLAAALLLGGSWSGHALDLNVQVTLAWTPWVLGLAARCGRGPGFQGFQGGASGPGFQGGASGPGFQGGASGPGWRDPLLLAGAYGVMLLQSMPQWGVYLAGAALVAALASARGAGALTPTAAALRVVLALTGAGVLAAPLLLPGIDYLRTYPRAQPGGWYAFVSAGGVELRDVPAWLVGGGREYLERFYPGAAVWALALLALLRADRRARPLLIGAPLLLAGLLLCGGDGSPVFRILVHLPPLSLFRCPARVLFLSQLGLAILAAGGLDLLRRAAAPRWAPRVAWASTLGALGLALWLQGSAAHGWPLVGAALSLTGLALAGEARGAGLRRAGLTAVALGLALELGLAHRAANPTRPDQELLAAPPLAAPVLRSDERRVLDLAGEGVSYDLLVRRLRRNSGTLWGLEYVSGYESLPPLVQEGLVAELSAALARDPARLAALCAQLSIRWVVTNEGVTLPGLMLAARDPLAGACLWEHPRARPRAYLLPRGGGPPLPARWSRPRAAELRVEVDAPAPGRLVVAEAWYPGWSVEVDGQPAELWEAPLSGARAPEDLFLSAPLPAGRHQVVFRFQDAWLELGLRLGAAAWLAWIAGLVLLIRRELTRSP